jgi:hypothetical protein
MRTFLAAFSFGMITLTFTSCVGMTKSVIKPKINTEIVPTDFDPQKHILLVAEMPNPKKPGKRHDGVTKQLLKQLQKNYPYQFEIVSLQDIKDIQAKFSDTSKYKYAMLNSISIFNYTQTSKSYSPVTNITTTTTSPNGGKIYSIDFGFYDRAQKKLYPLSGNNSSMLGYTIPAITETIQKALQERKKEKTSKKS